MEALDLNALCSALEPMVAPIVTDPLAGFLYGDPGKGGMSPPQRRFIESSEPLRFVRWPNQSGKTRIAAAEMWLHALGNHPLRDVPPAPNDGSILLTTLRVGWPKLCTKIREVEPPGVLHPMCRYDRMTGYTYRQSPGIMLANGSTITPYGSDQPVVTLSSGTFDWLWMDEPCKPLHWGEWRRGGAARNAPVWVTLTPVGRPVGWLRRIVEGDPEQRKGPEEPGWEMHEASLSVEDCPHRTQASIDAQIAGTPVAERSQRIYAGWEGVAAGRWIPAFADDYLPDGHVFGDEQGPSRELLTFGFGGDHGERPGTQAMYLAGYDGYRVWVFGEYVAEPGSGPVEHVRGFVDLMNVWQVKWHEIQEARGDTNSAGWLSNNMTINAVLENEFARVARTGGPPFHILAAVKVADGRKLRGAMLNTACLAGRFMVHDSCVHLRKALNYWEGKDDEHTHALDAITYLAQEWLGRPDAGSTAEVLTI